MWIHQYQRFWLQQTFKDYLWLLVLTSSNSVWVCHHILRNQAVQNSQLQHLLQLAVLRPLNRRNRLWSGSSSCSSNCPVLVHSQHLLNFSTMLLKCTLVQFRIAVLSSSGKLVDWISTSVQDRHWSDFSPRRMLNACSAYVATWRQASGTEWQKTLNFAHFSEWTWSTFDDVNPANGRFDFNSWF